MTMWRVFSGTRLAPNGTGFKFNKQVWDGYAIFFLNPGRVRVLPHPTPLRLHIKLILKLNLI